MLCSPYVVILNDSEEATLRRLANSARAPQRDVLRARIVLAAAQDTPNAQTAAALGVHVDTVRKWRRRFSKDGMDGLRDRPRPGRPRQFAPATVAEVKALACELPAVSETPLAKWSCPELAREAIATWPGRVGVRVHRAPLAGQGRDQALAAPDMDLSPRPELRHQSRPRARPLPAALRRPSPARRRVRHQRRRETRRTGPPPHPRQRSPPDPAEPMRVEHEYIRGGTLAYLAAYDVHRARVFGRCEPTTGIVPFTALVDQVMTTEPYASARRVFWIVDNGSSHSGWTAAKRLNDAYPNATMIHLPVHASWLNQIEIYFSVVQRKLLTPDDVDDLATLAERIQAFEQRYNDAATPFDWRFNTDDLHRLLQRLKP